MAQKELSFEEKLEKLKKIVEGLEAGEIPLKESIDKFKEGSELIKECYGELEGAELKVETVMKEKNNEN